MKIHQHIDILILKINFYVRVRVSTYSHTSLKCWFPCKMILIWTISHPFFVNKTFSLKLKRLKTGSKKLPDLFIFSSPKVHVLILPWQNFSAKQWISPSLEISYAYVKHVEKIKIACGNSRLTFRWHLGNIALLVMVCSRLSDTCLWAALPGSGHQHNMHLTLEEIDIYVSVSLLNFRGR